MESMKMGYIVKILHDENLVIIREDVTLTEWLVFLDEVKESFLVGSAVSFFRDEEYEQFVATDIKRIENFKTKRAV